MSMTSEAWVGRLSAAVDTGQWPQVIGILLEHIPEGPSISHRSRDAVLTRALQVQLKSDDLDAAWRTAANLRPTAWIEIYRNMALETATLQAEAVLRLQSLPPQGRREAVIECMLAICDIACRQEDGIRTIIESLQTLARQADDDCLDRLIKAAAVGLARSGQFSGAANLLAQLHTPTDETWGLIAREQVRRGLPDDAFRTAERMGYSPQWVKLMLLLGRDAAAERFVKSNHLGNRALLEHAWQQLALEAWHDRRLDEAQRFAAQVTDPDARAEMEILIIGVTESADAVRQRLASLGRHARGGVWYNQGMTHFNLGTLLCEKGALDAAAVLAEEIENPEWRVFLLRKLFSARCRAGDVESASPLLEDTGLDLYAETYADFGAALIRAGQTQMALDLARNLPASLNSALPPILGALLERKEMDAFKQLLPLCASDVDTLWELCAEILEVHPDQVGAIVDLLPVPFAARTN